MNISEIYKLLEKSNVSVLHNASKHGTSDDTVKYTLLKVQDLGKFFNISNPAEFFRKLARGDREERLIEFLHQPMGRPAMYIAEPIFYQFILTSDNPICLEIQDWVFDDVLKQISKNNSYSQNKETN